MSIKKQALAVMNKELGKAHSSELDMVHNWLCTQLDSEDGEKLAQGIVDKNKTLAKSFEFCYKKAKTKAAKGANFAMVANNEVFSWVKEYFLAKEDKKEESKNISSNEYGATSNKNNTKKKVKQSKQLEVIKQFSLFDDIDGLFDDING